MLVSWNFKHIVDLHRIHGYNSVNLRKGLSDARDQGAKGGQELAWLASQELKDPFLKRLRDKAVQQADAAEDASRRR